MYDDGSSCNRRQSHLLPRDIRQKENNAYSPPSHTFYEPLARQSKARSLVTIRQTPYRHYFLALLCIQRCFQPAHFPDSNSYDCGALHALKRTTGGQDYSSIELLRKAVDKEMIDGNMNGRHVGVYKSSQCWDKCMKKEK